ncbi:MAG: hypothetical protein J6T57_01035 [Alphaproteobacteria bacterium]|nr:hypothetical protein [Alphaproteobacteria bacterium]
MNFAIKKQQFFEFIDAARRAYKQRVATAHAGFAVDNAATRIEKSEIASTPTFVPKSWGTEYPCIFVKVLSGYEEWLNDNPVGDPGQSVTYHCPYYDKSSPCQQECQYRWANHEYMKKLTEHENANTEYQNRLAERRAAWQKLIGYNK